MNNDQYDCDSCLDIEKTEAPSFGMVNEQTQDQEDLNGVKRGLQNRD